MGHETTQPVVRCKLSRPAARISHGSKFVPVLYSPNQQFGLYSRVDAIQKIRGMLKSRFASAAHALKHVPCCSVSQ
jgi:hypothetical protein